MLGVGFLWSFANVVLSLILLTLIAYLWPNNVVGQTAAVIK